MDTLAFPILLAASIALAAFAITQLLSRRLGGSDRKIKQRLANEGGSKGQSTSANSILLAQEDEGSLSSKLARIDLLAKLEAKLALAFANVSLSRFVTIMLGFAVVGGLISLATSGSPIMGLGGAAGAGYLPMLYLNMRIGKRRKLIGDQLPESLEFLARILRAGHSLSTGIQMMGDELREPLAAEFRKCYAQHSLGAPLEDCMKDMARRIDSSDFAFFVTAVLIQRQTGGDLAEVLNNIAVMVRERIRLQQHVKAITAEGRLTGYILVAFPMVLFVISYVLNPGYAGLLLTTDMGRMMFGGAILMQFLGLFVIRKIIGVKV